MSLKKNFGKFPFYLASALGLFVAVAVLMNGSFDLRSKAYLLPEPSPRQGTNPSYKPIPVPSRTPISKVSPTPSTSSPSPVPSAAPRATSCSSVTVSGATYVGIVNGKSLYNIASGARATLTANVTPTNGVVNWKVASFSSLLPNGGSFSVNNQPVTVYTAPTNTSVSAQGVEIRGDISEYPLPWIYCPPITMSVQKQ